MSCLVAEVRVQVHAGTPDLHPGGPRSEVRAMRRAAGGGHEDWETGLFVHSKLSAK